MEDTDKNEILSAVVKISGKLDVMQGQITKMQKEVANIPEVQEKIAKIEKQVERVPEMQKEIAKIEKQVENVPEMQKEIRNISQRIAVMEYDHGDKLKVLFDAFMVNNEKIYGEQERISFCEKKLEKHDTEIYYLKTKVQGL